MDRTEKILAFAAYLLVSILASILLVECLDTVGNAL